MIEKINNIDEVSAFIIKYIPSAPITLTYHNSFHFEGDKEVTNILGRYSSECGYVCFTICTETGTGDSGTVYTGDHIAGSDCHNPQHQHTVCFSFCDAAGGSGAAGDGDDPGPAPSDPGSGGAGGSGSGTNPTVPDPPAESGATQPELELAPVYDLPQQDNTEPCDELKNLVDGDDITYAISMVETNDDHEHGYSFTKPQTQESAFVANEIPNYILIKQN
ncbi:MAG TPA: hypothetical protein VK623_00375 [Flavobacterium sp.]|nr:hypothetical protein [Flavobacterium sp.]